MVGFRTKAENHRIIENGGAGVSSDDGILGGLWTGLLQRERLGSGSGDWSDEWKEGGRSR